MTTSVEVVHSGLPVVVKGDGFKPVWSPREETPDVVDCTFAFRMEEGKARYRKSVVLDFSGCSRSELVELAGDSVVITVQRWLRESKNGATDPSLFSRVSVKDDVVNRTRAAGPVDKGERILRDAASLGMPPELAEAVAAWVTSQKSTS